MIYRHFITNFCLERTRVFKVQRNVETYVKSTYTSGIMDSDYLVSRRFIAELHKFRTIQRRFRGR